MTMTEPIRTHSQRTAFACRRKLNAVDNRTLIS
jgi:hypothetical protein